mgnify:CR=1 FL=1
MGWTSMSGAVTLLLLASGASGRRTVAIIGAASGIGPPLALLLRQSTLISELRLWDVMPAAGLASDLQHVDAPGTAAAYSELSDCLFECDVVVLTAAVARAPGMSRQDHFSVNAHIVLKVTEACASQCPEALLVICTEPVSSMVPLACEVFKRANVRRAAERVLGVTAADGMCANACLAQRVGSVCEPATLRVPVIGGHGATALPLFSKLDLSDQLSADDVSALTRRVRSSGAEVLAASQGRTTAVYSVALAAARFVERVLAAREGEENVVVHAFVQCPRGSAPYMTQPVLLCRRGVGRVLQAGSLSGTEQCEFELLLPKLLRAAKRGKDVVAQRGR